MEKILLYDIEILELETQVESDFIRVINELERKDPYKTENTQGIFNVLKAHYLIANFFYQEGEGLGGIGPRSLDLLHSALFRQFSGFGDVSKWTDVFQIAATLMFGIIKNHPFHDANKRTAFLTTLHFLYANGYTTCVSEKDFEDFTVDIADGRYKNFVEYKKLQKNAPSDAEILYIARALRSKTRKIDARYYAITYRELNKILKRFDCYLDSPSGNYINVMKTFRKKKGVIRKRIVEEDHRVAKIGFPGWTTQVGKGAISTVRKSTNLTPEYGIDSQTFFKNLDTMEELIAHYRDPLKRLADR
ncbi:type II toxin-antitoxin system death-on-curing family toxin [Roseibium aggregatum]|uniref:type II toxin-antitoxin system death-on-curing family toxin n=1 Tax=Roseibium aggregatum TaxID=187304 RepID=UPI001E5FED8B|nr:type II toxin-antitoxin system death-on-curing family toxin [Roseibium aggregatum]UES50542.1 type II toxin-antitoxin system death-on-curing family toxin [Roseibium aggregatum]